MAPPSANPHDLDGLDDLDDVLNEFNEEAKPSAAPAATSTAPDAKPVAASAPTAKKATVEDDSSSAAPGTGTEPDLASDDFAALFAQGLQDMLAGLGEAPGGASEGKSKAVPSEGTDPASAGPGAQGELNEEELMKQFERLLFGGTGLDPNAGASTSQPAGSAAPATPGSAQPAKPGNFQDTIAATMNRLKTSDKNATSSTSAGAGEDELRKMFEALRGAGADGAPNLDELLKSLGDLGDLGDGEGEGYQKMLENMLQDLMGKEVLYGPMKEMNDQYPAFLASDKFKGLPTGDKERFTKQAGIVKQIVALFEDPAWEDEPELPPGADPATRPPASPAQQERQKKLQDLMNSMQDCGAPPDEIVGDVPEGLDSLGKDEDCTIM